MCAASLCSMSSSQTEALLVLVVNGVNNTLHRELRPVVLDLHHVAAFVVCSFNYDCSDQLITLIRN